MFPVSCPRPKYSPPPKNVSSLSSSHFSGNSLLLSPASLIFFPPRSFCWAWKIVVISPINKKKKKKFGSIFPFMNYKKVCLFPFEDLEFPVSLLSLPSLQSNFYPHYSSKTSLIKVTSDCCVANSGGQSCPCPAWLIKRHSIVLISVLFETLCCPPHVPST